MVRQEQSSGDDSTNIQAGGNVTVHYGVTATEARQIALGIFWENFIALKGVAEQVARDRATEITESFLKDLIEKNPGGLNSMRDPDMLLSVYNAQKGYACSGDADLETALVDLLVERAGETERNLKTPYSQPSNRMPA